MDEFVPQKKNKLNVQIYIKRYIYVFSLALILILGTSYGLTFFKQNMKIGEINITVGGLTTTVTEDKTISLTNLQPVTDLSGINLNSKEITITNTSALNGKVNVTLSKTSGLDLTDLKYALYVNGILQTIGDVPSDGNIFNSAILGNETLNIKISLWVKETYTGSETTFDGELIPDIKLGSLLASDYIKELSTKEGSTVTETSGNYNYASDSTKNYVNFNCNNGTCEKWRIVGVEDGRMILTTDTYVGTTFTNSNKFNQDLVLNDYSLVTSMSTDNHAVYLNKTVRIVGGNGTSTSPYILEDDQTPSIQDKKVLATLTYNNDGTTTTQPIYYGQTNYISQVIDDTSFQGWSDGTNTYQLGNTIAFTTDTTLNAVIKLTLNQKIMKLCNDPNISYVQKYNGNDAIDDYQGLGDKEVCYYTSTLSTMDENDPVRQNSNVIFGDYCWQIVRTTTTGGVKMVYNGLKTVDNKCPFAAASRPSSQGFVGSSNGSTSLSGSKTYGTGFTYSGTEFTLTNPFTATWSESDANSNGTPDYQELIGTYTCNKASNASNSDKCTTLYYVGHYQSATNASTLRYTIGTLAHYSQIGTTFFNVSDSPALVGYMYNDAYNVTSRSFTTSSPRFFTQTSSMGSKNYIYGDKATWNDTTNMYDLTVNDGTSDVTPSTDPTDWSTIYARADHGVGLYTCLSGTDTSCATVHYIEYAANTYMYTLALSNGETADNDPDTGKKLVVSSTKTDNATDYSLGTTTNVYLFDFYSNSTTRNSAVNKYICSDYTSTTCTTMYYITSAGSTNITYNSSALHNFTYANDVSYNASTGEYTLVIDDNTKTFFDWKAKYNTINSAHYTCFGNYNSTTHSCGTEVYYINYTDGSNAYYAKLREVANIETALKKMLNYGSGADTNINKYDSAIKGLIDNWYAQNIDANNLTQYLEDAVYCNDRSVTNPGSWVKTNSTTSSYKINFKNSSTSFGCANMTDRFSSDSNNTLAHLRYPVGLLTYAESVKMNTGYRRTGQDWWLSAPVSFETAAASAYYVNSSGSLTGYTVSHSRGARPAVSLAQNIEMSGEGTYDNPYIVITE